MQNPTVESLTIMFEKKKASCKSRLLSFDLTLDQWIALYKMRSTLTCYYTDVQFDMRDTSRDNYPTLERINGDMPYSVGNICFCTAKVNRLKSQVIENGLSTKGIGGVNANIVQRIKKVLNNPEMAALRLKPYEDIFAKVAEREQEKQAKIVKDAIKDELQLRNERIKQVKIKADKELALAKNYQRISEEFTNAGAVFDMSIKEVRDCLRITKCKISGVVFENDNQKHFWVKDKTGFITKDNVVVVTKSVQESLDHISKGSMETLLTCVKNLDKNLNK